MDSLSLDNLTVLPRTFYERPTVTVAKDLLGRYLVFESSVGLKIGQITETEAYPGIGDRASHSHRGPTPRTEVLFGPAGTIYIYLIYGMYHCLNVVTDRPETGGAVLIRSVDPIIGVESRTDGPGRLCRALGIDRQLNGQSVTESCLTIRSHKAQALVPTIEALPRVGIDYAGEDKHHLYRFRIASAESLPYTKRATRRMSGQGL